MKKIIKIKETVDLPEKIIGISAQETDYKIAWEINTLLQTELIKQPDKLYHDKKIEEEIRIPFYYFKSEEGIKYFMIKNTSPEYSLFTGKKHIDYILLILPGDDFLLKTTHQLLKKGKNFLGSFVLELNKLEQEKIKALLK